MNAFVDEGERHVLVDARSQDLRTYPRRSEVRWLLLDSVRAADLEGLSSWEQLIDLAADDARLQRLDGVEHLRQLRRLHVAVQSAALDIDALRRLPTLVSFGLFPADGVADLTPIGHLEGLRELAIGQHDPALAPRLAEVPFGRLTQLEQLRWTSDWRQPATLDDLAPLAALTELRHLDIGDTIVSCRLDVLHRLPNLRDVEIVHPDAAIERERFAAARPDVRAAISKPVDRDAPFDELTPREIYADGQTWWVLAADLAERFGLDTNYQAEERVAAAVQTEAPEVARRLDYDTEADCFCVRSTREEDLQAVRTIIDALTDPSTAT